MTLFIKDFDSDLAEKLKKTFRQKTLTGAINLLCSRYYLLLDRLFFLMRENDELKQRLTILQQTIDSKDLPKNLYIKNVHYALGRDSFFLNGGSDQ